MNMNKIAIVYARISSPEQNLDSQEFSCMEYANQNGFNVVKVFKEVGSSRYSTENLSVLNNLITSYTDFVLIVYSVDRLSRNTHEAEYLYNTFRANNINVVSVSENFNVLENRAVFYNRIQLAQNESDLISQRVKRSIDFRKAKGDYIGGVPYGKKLISIVLKKDRNVNNAEQLYNQQNFGDNSGELISDYIPETLVSDIIVRYNPETEYIRKVLFTDLYESAVIKFIKDCCNKKLNINEVNYRFFILAQTLDLVWDIEEDKLKFYNANYLDDDFEYTGSDKQDIQLLTIYETYSKKSVFKQSKKIMVKPNHISDILNRHDIAKRQKFWTPTMVLSCL